MYNFLQNTQFQVRTGMLANTKMNSAGTGTQTAISFTNFTPSSTSPILYTTNTQQLKQGDLIKITGTSVAGFNLTLLRVKGIAVNNSIQVTLPLGLATPATSVACTGTPMLQYSNGSTNGNGPDSYTITSGVNCWIDDFPINSCPGSKLQCGLQLTSTSQQVFYYTVPAADVSLYQGKTICFGMQCLQKIGSGTAQIILQTDSGSNFGTNFIVNGSYEYSELSVLIPTNAAYITMGIVLNGAIGDVYYVSQPKAVVGTTCGDYTFDNRELVPICKMTPISLNTASFTIPAFGDGYGTYGFPVDIFQETNGAIDPSVRIIKAQLEGKCATGQVALAMRNIIGLPPTYGVTTYCPSAGSWCTAYGHITLANGCGFLYSANASVSWSFTSLDINGYLL